MNKYDLKSLAIMHGIDDKRLSRVELIRQIQYKEGNFDCFATALNGHCDQNACSWREECLDSAIEKNIKKSPHSLEI